MCSLELGLTGPTGASSSPAKRNFLPIQGHGYFENLPSMTRMMSQQFRDQQSRNLLANHYRSLCRQVLQTMLSFRAMGPDLSVSLIISTRPAFLSFY